MTTRAETQWVNPAPSAISKLEFHWVNKDRAKFSFDIGGILKGGDLEGQVFVGESKYYHVYGALAEHYRKYLAQCYCAYIDRPSMCDHFFFITWHPFSVTDWGKLNTPDNIREAVRLYQDSTLRVSSSQEEYDSVDEDVCQKVSERLWLLVLSDRQEKELIMSGDDLALVRAARTKAEYSDA